MRSLPIRASRRLQRKEPEWARRTDEAYRRWSSELLPHDDCRRRTRRLKLDGPSNGRKDLLAVDLLESKLGKSRSAVVVSRKTVLTPWAVANCNAASVNRYP